jgi:hypothetical protein
MCSSRWKALVFLAAAVAALTAAPAQASVDVGIQTGPVVGVDMPDLTVRPAMMVVGHRMWCPAARLHLGVRAAIGVTALPYGNNDGEPVIGRRGGYNPAYFETAPTVIPSLAFAPRLEITDDLRVGAALGVAFMVSSEMGSMSLIPLKTAGLAVDYRLTKGTGGSLGGRLGVDWTASTFGSMSPGVVTPYLGLVWEL